MKVERSTAHSDKLTALLNNASLPVADKARVEATLRAHTAWIDALDNAKGEGQALLQLLIRLLNDYKLKVELDLIFDSTDNFLYRQGGQTKLAGSVLEEFLPRLFDSRLVPGLAKLPGIQCGPKKCFSHLSFGSPVLALGAGGVFLKTKDQDFAVTKDYKLTIADNGNQENAYDKQVSVSYFASEIKTNLDKTMFQEANATAGELKAGVPGARYILLCEWLDMSPIDTKLTPIDEVIILRKAKRLASNVRDKFSTVAGRKQARARYAKYLNEHPLHIESFQRLLFHLNEVFPEATSTTEGSILQRGYF